jgi:hypothetical protein
LILVALAVFMRLSLTKAAHAAMSSVAWQEIRLRSGRDGKFVEPWTGVRPLENWQFQCKKFVISAGAQRSGEICGFFFNPPRSLEPPRYVFSIPSATFIAMPACSGFFHRFLLTA